MGDIAEPDCEAGIRDNESDQQKYAAELSALPWSTSEHALAESPTTINPRDVDR